MPSKKLGQHFLYDASILNDIIRASDLLPGDTAVEIGPGPGALTRLLAGRVEKVVAVEIDARLCEKLRKTLPGNVELIHGDALKFPYDKLGPFKVVSNIPYQITTPLIFRLFKEKGRLDSMTLTVQKEVADRITSKPGIKDYGVLSVMVQYHAKAELKFHIPRTAFKPPPKVDSACIHLRLLDNPPVEVEDENLFFETVRTAFSHRRKTLLNALKSMSDDIKGILRDSGIDPTRRPETLSIEEFARISGNIRS